MLAPDVAAAVAVIVKPAGVVTEAIVDPEAGEVMEMVGVAWATVKATKAQAAVKSWRSRNAGGREIALGTTRIHLAERFDFMAWLPGLDLLVAVARAAFGAGGRHDGRILEERVGGGALAGPASSASHRGSRDWR